MSNRIPASYEPHFEVVSVIKETEDKSIVKVRHRSSGALFLMRRLPSSADIYRQLLPVSSPYLPRIYEVLEEDDCCFILEEFVEGDLLSDMLQGATFSPSETRRISLDICKALYILHDLGLVHRDVKPENIMLRGQNAVLLDFDTSRQFKEEGTTDTQVLGTTGFAAPEQYGISQTDARADIFALGVTMHLMLTGAHPSVKLAPGRFGRIISKCTMVQPDKRYSNILHLMKVLRS